MLDFQEKIAYNLDHLWRVNEEMIDITCQRNCRFTSEKENADQKNFLYPQQPKCNPRPSLGLFLRRLVSVAFNRICHLTSSPYCFHLYTDF